MHPHRPQNNQKSLHDDENDDVQGQTDSSRRRLARFNQARSSNVRSRGSFNNGNRLLRRQSSNQQPQPPPPPPPPPQYPPTGSQLPTFASSGFAATSSDHCRSGQPNFSFTSSIPVGSYHKSSRPSSAAGPVKDDESSSLSRPSLSQGQPQHHAGSLMTDPKQTPLMSRLLAPGFAGGNVSSSSLRGNEWLSDGLDEGLHKGLSRSQLVSTSKIKSRPSQVASTSGSSSLTSPTSVTNTATTTNLPTLTSDDPSSNLTADQQQEEQEEVGESPSPPRDSPTRDDEFQGRVSRRHDYVNESQARLAVERAAVDDSSANQRPRRRGGGIRRRRRTTTDVRPADHQVIELTSVSPPNRQSSGGDGENGSQATVDRDNNFRPMRTRSQPNFLQDYVNQPRLVRPALITVDQRLPVYRHRQPVPPPPPPYGGPRPCVRHSPSLPPATARFINWSSPYGQGRLPTPSRPWQPVDMPTDAASASSEDEPTDGSLERHDDDEIDYQDSRRQPFLDDLGWTTSSGRGDAMATAHLTGPDDDNDDVGHFIPPQQQSASAFPFSPPFLSIASSHPTPPRSSIATALTTNPSPFFYAPTWSPFWPSPPPPPLSGASRQPMGRILVTTTTATMTTIASILTKRRLAPDATTQGMIEGARGVDVSVETGTSFYQQQQVWRDNQQLKQMLDQASRRLAYVDVLEQHVHQLTLLVDSIVLSHQRQCQLDFELDRLSATAQLSNDEPGYYQHEQPPPSANTYYQSPSSSLMPWQSFPDSSNPLNHPPFLSAGDVGPFFYPPPPPSPSNTSLSRLGGASRRPSMPLLNAPDPYWVGGTRPGDSPLSPRRRSRLPARRRMQRGRHHHHHHQWGPSTSQLWPRTLSLDRAGGEGPAPSMHQQSNHPLLGTGFRGGRMRPPPVVAFAMPPSRVVVMEEEYSTNNNNNNEDSNGCAAEGDDEAGNDTTPLSGTAATTTVTLEDRSQASIVQSKLPRPSMLTPSSLPAPGSYDRRIFGIASTLGDEQCCRDQQPSTSSVLSSSLAAVVVVTSSTQPEDNHLTVAASVTSVGRTGHIESAELLASYPTDDNALSPSLFPSQQRSPKSPGHIRRNIGPSSTSLGPPPWFPPPSESSLSVKMPLLSASGSPITQASDSALGTQSNVDPDGSGSYEGISPPSSPPLHRQSPAGGGYYLGGRGDTWQLSHACPPSVLGRHDQPSSGRDYRQDDDRLPTANECCPTRKSTLLGQATAYCCRQLIPSSSSDQSSSTSTNPIKVTQQQRSTAVHFPSSLLDEDRDRTLCTKTAAPPVTSMPV